MNFALIKSLKNFVTFEFNFIQDGIFWGYPRMGGGKKVSLPKSYHTYPTMIKIGTVILDLKKIRKIYESHDKVIEFC